MAKELYTALQVQGLLSVIADGLTEEAHNSGEDGIDAKSIMDLSLATKMLSRLMDNVIEEMGKEDPIASELMLYLYGMRTILELCEKIVLENEEDISCALSCVVEAINLLLTEIDKACGAVEE